MTSHFDGFSVKIIALAFALLSPVAACAGSTETRVVTPRGATIAVIAEKPPGSGPFPAIVLGSGSSYSKQAPVLEQTAQALLARGIAVYRFDWAYQIAGTPFAEQPKDRRAEIEDMNTVLALARADTAIDSHRLAVGGKSLGSIIAWRVLRATPELKGALLLTPVCSREGIPDAGAVNYPGLAEENRPLSWILGESDPACPVITLYRFLSGANGAPRVTVVGGDHSFESAGAPARTGPTLDLVARLAADFTRALLGPETSR